MARVLIVGGGCRGRALASALLAQRHAVRITTRSETGRSAIESRGAECIIGDPARLATLRSALEHVAVACWLLGSATGPSAQLRELHSSRLQRFLEQAVDTTLRGFIYEATGTTVAPATLAQGARTVQAVTQRNAIPAAFITADPRSHDDWLRQARSAIDALLGDGRGRSLS